MSNAQIESDPLFQLLTDALRAGPQSPEWAQAVSRIRESGSTEADEYQALLRAREDLENGREYKSVRAGAGFTRELLGKIEEEKDAAKAKGLPTATLLAVGAGVVLLLVIGVVAFLSTRGGGKGDGRETLPTLFPATVLDQSFVMSPIKEWNKRLTSGGDLRIDRKTDGIRPEMADGAPQGMYTSGAVYLDPPVPAGVRFEAEADIEVPQGVTPSVITLVFAEPSGTTSGGGGLSWLVEKGEQRVRLGDRTLAAAPAPAGGKVNVRLVIGKTVGAVYVNKTLLWSGEHGFAPDAPVAPGVRFLRAVGDEGKPLPVVKSLRVRSE